MLGRVVLAFGQSVTDGFAVTFGGPEVVGPLVDPLAGHLASESSADHGAITDPTGAGQAGQEFRISGRVGTQRRCGGDRHGPKDGKIRLDCQGVYLY